MTHSTTGGPKLCIKHVYTILSSIPRSSICTMDVRILKRRLTMPMKFSTRIRIELFSKLVERCTTEGAFLAPARDTRGHKIAFNGVRGHLGRACYACVVQQFRPWLSIRHSPLVWSEQLTRQHMH